MTAGLDAAREAFEQHRWDDARTAFIQLRDGGAALTAADLQMLGDAEWWLGLMDDCLGTAAQTYQAFLDAGDPRRASMATVDLAVVHLLRGQVEPAMGWLARGQRLLAGLPPGPEHGYFLQLEAESALDEGDLARGWALVARVRELGTSHDDRNLIAAATVLEGRLHVKAGAPREGMALLDAAMVAATSGELSPVWSGNVYCHLMSACHELGDIRRAGIWTKVASDWCDQMSAAVMFTGICRVHRAQVLQTRGDWDRSAAEAHSACEELIGVHVAAVGEASYQVGEIHRLRGEFAEAERAYDRAHGFGRDPQPGVALLRAAQGRIDAAAASLRVALAGAGGPLLRARLLAAQVEVATAAGDVATATTASAELDAIADTFGSSGLVASALQHRGTARLAAGSPEEALGPLRDACTRWIEVEAPYESARTRVSIALACRALGDDETSARELGAAIGTFTALGAIPDADAAASLLAGGHGALSPRETEVVGLVARGLTNRQIAGELTLSEKTVARHLSNIFAKLGVSSRTAAAAYAFEHGLAHRTDG